MAPTPQLDLRKLIDFLLDDLRRSPGRDTLFLARTHAEMTQVAKYVDRVLRRSMCFTRMAYEGDRDHYLYTLTVDVEEEEDEPSDLWVAEIHEATPDTILYFREDGLDLIAWPDDSGLYSLVDYNTWKTPWLPWIESWRFNKIKDQFEEPFFRPPGVISANPSFEVGPPLGWTPPVPLPPRVSVWDRLVRNSSIRLSSGEEVTTHGTEEDGHQGQDQEHEEGEPHGQEAGEEIS
jgi:hypothetical protein